MLVTEDIDTTQIRLCIWALLLPAYCGVREQNWCSSRAGLEPAVFPVKAEHPQCASIWRLAGCSSQDLVSNTTTRPTGTAFVRHRPPVNTCTSSSPPPTSPSPRTERSRSRIWNGQPYELHVAHAFYTACKTCAYGPIWAHMRSVPNHFLPAQLAKLLTAGQP